MIGKNENLLIKCLTEREGVTQDVEGTRNAKAKKMDKNWAKPDPKSYTSFSQAILIKKKKKKLASLKPLAHENKVFKEEIFCH